MILTGSEIIKEVKNKNITLDPFNIDQVNPNSYNYRLGQNLKVFSSFTNSRGQFKEIELPKNGYLLKPKRLYLGQTLESIGSKKYAMSLIGRSSLGRLGLFLQVSANLGHTTCTHQWTLEIYPCLPFKVYPEMVIGQVSFWVNYGEIKKYQGFYGNLNNPQESMMFTD